MLESGLKKSSRLIRAMAWWVLVMRTTSCATLQQNHFRDCEPTSDPTHWLLQATPLVWSMEQQLLSSSRPVVQLPTEIHRSHASSLGVLSALSRPSWPTDLCPRVARRWKRPDYRWMTSTVGKSTRHSPVRRWLASRISALMSTK